MSCQVENTAQYGLSLGPVQVDLESITQIWHPAVQSRPVQAMWFCQIILCAWMDCPIPGHSANLCGIYDIYGYIWYLWFHMGSYEEKNGFCWCRSLSFCQLILPVSDRRWQMAEFARVVRQNVAELLFTLGQNLIYLCLARKEKNCWLFSNLTGTQGVKKCNLNVKTFETLGKLQANYNYHIQQHNQSWKTNPSPQTHSHAYTGRAGP